MKTIKNIHTAHPTETVLDINHSLLDIINRNFLQ